MTGVSRMFQQPLRRFLCVAALLLCWIALPCRAYDAGEHLLKAVFVERFTRFIEWPQDSPKSDSTAPFVIAVVNDSRFAFTLRDVYSRVKICGRTVHVVDASADSVPPCQIVFIGAGESLRLSADLQRLNGRPVLTIGDTEGFAHRGVHVNFYINESNQIRFEVNHVALQKSGLKISHLLLGLARVVDPPAPEHAR
jgi:hypothetical protein